MTGEARLPDLTRSLALQKRAARRIPGMVQLLSKRPDRFSSGVWPGYFSRARGAEVWDLDGNRYIDMSIGGIGANVLGYADPDVDAAVRAAVDAGTSCSLNCPEEVELADLLCEIHPWADMARFARAGGEAVAMAVRIARARTRRDLVAVCGYHGWHDWYLAANLQTRSALAGHLMPGLNPLGVPKALAGTVFPFHYNRIDELEAICAQHGRKLAAIVMEPIRNDPPLPDFFPRIKDLARQTGAVLVVDEISAGFRLNSGGAHLTLNVEPDMAVFSKAMGNGYPVAAVIGRGDVMTAAQDTFISSTMWTERLGPAAALATIQKHRACNVAAHLVEMGRRVQDGWKACAQKHGIGIEVGGIAPLSHFQFDEAASQHMKALFIQEMLSRGFLSSTLFYAMFAHQPVHVERYLEAVDTSFSKISALREGNGIEKALRGEPAAKGFGRLT